MPHTLSACGDHQDRCRFWSGRRCFKNTPVQDARNKLSTLVFFGDSPLHIGANRKPLGPLKRIRSEFHFNQATRDETHFCEVNCISRFRTFLNEYEWNLLKLGHVSKLQNDTSPLGRPDTPATGGSYLRKENNKLIHVAELPEWIAAHTYWKHIENFKHHATSEI